MKIVVTKNVDSFMFAIHMPTAIIEEKFLGIGKWYVKTQRWLWINLVFWTVTINRPERSY